MHCSAAAIYFYLNLLQGNVHILTSSLESDISHTGFKITAAVYLLISHILLN